MAKSNLVIVESPAKAKTIGKYLGPGYQVKASMGHVRDLPKSKLGVDLEHGFVPDYQPIKGKEEVISDLKKAVKGSDKVYLATDPDREGEAISWHLKELLNLPDNKTFRVTFNEITKKVVNDAIANPRTIDMDLVDAQQARRILDRLVGYQLSPLLWKKIRRGLSAGRVQSVATRLVAEREAEIKAFQPEEYWSLDVNLDRIAPCVGQFQAAFYGRDKRIELKTETDVDVVANAIQTAAFSVSAVKRQDKQRNPPPPFTTSTLQQEASRKLNMTPRRTMAVAQQLYEGVDIDGEGTVGLITYMRTDSLRLSDEATAAAKTFILSTYGKDYYPNKVRQYKTKSGAQDAHEAIRPSDVNLTPDGIKKSLTSEQYRLYKLIWSRFLACQMSSAVFDSVSIEVTAAGYTFRATNSALKFSGYMAVYVESREEEEPKQSPLPDLKEGEALSLTGMNREQHFTKPPARYSEATLIKALEEKGIGRPSTYAPTVSTILDRYYVVKEGKALRTTPLGEVVTGLMLDKFPDIVDTAFTAHMEEQLDQVEAGKVEWGKLLDQFYEGFDRELKQAETDLDGERIKIPDELSDEVCDLCGRQMVIKMGRFGRFLACPGYPECNFTKPIVIEMPGKCPLCGGRLLKKTSKRGFPYYGCENNSNKDEQKKCGFMTWDVPVQDNCPECGHTMFKRSGKGAMKPFCINSECPNFLPEDKRGYKRKPKTENAETAETAQEKSVESAAQTEATEKKPAVKKTTAKKTAKTAGKKTTKKTAAKKDTKEAAEKPKTTRKRPAQKAEPGEG
ncbi:MAG: type I DNA topoisomerase [Oscillospiraceae bacterium]|nr:type I DNA topoisomerase [Oscillospiraceae bacterium]